MLNPESPSTAPALIDPASKAFQSLLDKLRANGGDRADRGRNRHRQGGGGPPSPHHHSARRQQPFLAVNCGAR
ncbi:hypothetical protein LNP17_24880 [Klebsiella variicola subsp. variicola]|nr:hypothetical protein [Klebsiella variicola subsp. variicola]